MVDLGMLVELPAWIVLTGAVAVTASLAVGIPLARRAGQRAAMLNVRSEHGNPPPRQDRVALVAALVPSIIVWLAVMGVSFIGLTGFASAAMNWDHWTNILVPLSLDGISISFGGWAFVAVKRGRHSGRAYRIVLAAAGISSLLNYVHGKDEWSVWAGIYVAFLSFVGMAMFHEMLHQFMAGYDDDIVLKVRYPRFGQRWLYSPWTTWGALRIWIVFPPAEGTRPTINNALAHWAKVNRIPRGERHTLYIESANGKSLTIHNKALPESLNPMDLGICPDLSAETQPRQPKPQTAVLRRHPKRNENSMSNAEINAAAEDLWIAAMREGEKLSGERLLSRFHATFPGQTRGRRWAVLRCKAARTRLAFHTVEEELDEDEILPA